MHVENGTKRFKWTIPAPVFSLSVFQILSQVWSQEKTQYVITQLFTSKSWILSNVTVIKVKIACYFHLLLSTKNFNFKNSVFLIMPNVVQKNDHSRVWSPYPSLVTLGAPQHSKMSIDTVELQRSWCSQQQNDRMALYNHMVYYVSNVTRNEIKS